MTESGVPARRRIARVIARLNIGGPAIQAMSLSRRLRPFGFDTVLLYGRLAQGEGDMSYLLGEEAVTCHVPTLGRPVAPLDDLRACWQLYRFFCRFRPQIVHTHTAKAGAVGRLAAIGYNLTAGRRDPARLVHTYHGHVFDGYFGSTSTDIFIAIERWLAKRTDALIAISPQIRIDIRDTYRIARDRQVRTVPLGFDLEPFLSIDDRARVRARAALGIGPDERVVTTVGRLTEIKRHDLFVRMAQLLSGRTSGVRFLIVGDGELRQQLETLAAGCGVRASVMFLGWRADLTTIYGATDVFALTSRNEGTPVALIEAMASGVPGVSTDVGGVRDVVVSRDVGVLVPFGDGEALAGAIGDLLASPERRRRMGESARTEVRVRYHLDRLLSDLTGLYDELLSRGSPPGA